MAAAGAIVASVAADEVGCTYTVTAEVIVAGLASCAALACWACEARPMLLP
jgi:hypothetical protein